MADHKDFNAALQERRTNRPTFGLGDTTFTVPPASSESLFLYGARAQRASEMQEALLVEGGGLTPELLRELDAMCDEFMDAAVGEAQVDALRRERAELGLSLEEKQEIVGWLIEASTGRSFTPPSPSPSPASTTSPSSTAALPPPAGSST